MKILYLSCHSILEYDECKLLSELGHEVRSIGSYTNPHSPADPKRPAIKSMKVDDQHIQISNRFHQDNLHQEHLDWADVIIFMHMPDWILDQWQKLQQSKKPIIFRSIGQSSPDVEMKLYNIKSLLGDQFKVIRYSTHEQNISPSRGAYFEDALIYFYKDENEFQHDWPRFVHNNDLLFVTQAATQRGTHCHFDELELLTRCVSDKRILVGPSNDDWSDKITTLCLDYTELLNVYKKSKLFIYSGTIPASYTLAIIEAMMIGTPVITISQEWWSKGHEWIPKEVFEIPDLLPRQVVGQTGDWSRFKSLLDDKDTLLEMSYTSRTIATSRFSRHKAEHLWTNFLKSL